MAACALLLTALAPQSSEWTTYTNVRFRFAGCYPPARLHAGGEAPNADGQRFTAGDGAVALMFGANNALNRTQAQIMADDTAAMLGPATKPSYQMARTGVFVVSGVRDGQVLYEKTLIAGDQYATLRLTYPRKLAGTYDPVVARMARCFASTP